MRNFEMIHFLLGNTLWLANSFEAYLLLTRRVITIGQKDICGTLESPFLYSRFWFMYRNFFFYSLISYWFKKHARLHTIKILILWKPQMSTWYLSAAMPVIVKLSLKVKPSHNFSNTPYLFHNTWKRIVHWHRKKILLVKSVYLSVRVSLRPKSWRTVKKIQRHYSLPNSSNPYWENHTLRGCCLFSRKRQRLKKDRTSQQCFSLLSPL